MKLINTGTTVIKIYSDIKEMPVKRNKEFNRHLLYMAGVGNDMDTIGQHYQKLFGLIAAGQMEPVKTEVENLYYNHYAILNNIDFKTKAFACLVYSIGDTILDDLSDDGLDQAVKLIEDSGITQDALDSATEDVKKK